MKYKGQQDSDSKTKKTPAKEQGNSEHNLEDNSDRKTSKSKASSEEKVDEMYLVGTWIVAWR